MTTTTKARALDLLAIAHRDLARCNEVTARAEDHRAYCAHLALEAGATYKEVATVIDAASVGAVTKLLSRWRRRTGRRVTPKRGITRT